MPHLTNCNNFIVRMLFCDSNLLLTVLTVSMSLSIPPQIQRWIFQFFTGHQQAVISGGQQSIWLPITRSVVQVSGIASSAYLVYSMDLKALSSYNSILKYVDE